MTQSIVHCIGITGMNGAGKTTVATLLQNHFFLAYQGVRDFLEMERKLRGLPNNRESLQFLANDFREKYGPAYVMEKLVEIESRDIGCDTPFIIESIRCVGEVEYLQEEFGDRFALVGVDAPLDLRYSRIVKRATATDDGGYVKFCKDEDFEMNQEDPWKQNLRGCMGFVDAGRLIWNDKQSEEDLLRQVFDIGRRLKLCC